MKTRKSNIIFMILACLLGTGAASSKTQSQQNSANYCTPSAGSPEGQYIKNVTINNYSNDSGSGTNGYDDFTAQSTLIEETAKLSITPQATWPLTKAIAWADWNKNGTFDTNEVVLNASGTNGAYSTDFNTPKGVTGNVTLRVRVTYSADPTPCGQIYFSDTEDYTLNLGNTTKNVIAPTSLTTTLQENLRAVALTWANDGITEGEFEIERSTDGVAYAVITTVNANTTSFIDQTVSNNVRYTYKIRTKVAANYSEYSRESSITVPQGSEGSAAPSGLTASLSETKNDAINLSWIDNSNNETGFRIDAMPNSNIAPITINVAPNTTSHTLSNLTLGITYFIKIVALNNNITSDPSNEVNITIPVAQSAAPSGLTLSLNEGQNAVHLSWNDNSDNEDGFQIERLVHNGQFSAIFTTSANVTSYTDNDVSPGLFHQYRIRSKRGTLFSEFSYNIEGINVPETQVTTVNAPSELSATLVASLSNAVSLTWKDNSNNEDGFIIERAQGNGVFELYKNFSTVDQTSFLDTHLPTGETFSYRIKAKKGNAMSAFSNGTTITITPVYCTERLSGTPSGQYIKNVTIGSIKKKSSHNETGYENYRDLSADIASNSFPLLSITPQTAWDLTKAKAWIDWNKDGDFDDANEEVLSDSGRNISRGGIYNQNIQIPEGVSGAVTLRVRVAYSTTPTPCNRINFSETEDYTLNIVVANQAKTALQATTISVTPNPANDQIQIQGINANEGYVIYTITGTKVTPGTYTNAIDVTSLKSGQYFIKIPSQQKTVTFIKQ